MLIPRDSLLTPRTPNWPKCGKYWDTVMSKTPKNALANHAYLAPKAQFP
jgi:hypothetical protein